MPDADQGFVRGWVIKEEGEVSTVALEADEQVCAVCVQSPAEQMR